MNKSKIKQFFLMKTPNWLGYLCYAILVISILIATSLYLFPTQVVELLKNRYL